MGLTTESLVNHLDKSPYMQEENIVSAVWLLSTFVMVIFSACRMSDGSRPGDSQRRKRGRKSWMREPNMRDALAKNRWIGRKEGKGVVLRKAWSLGHSRDQFPKALVESGLDELVYIAE